jgi:dTDP-4-amino-4,6-dideoxygalactose transaminase
MINYPLASNTWDEKELNAIQQVIDSGMFTMGEKVKSYENSFAEFFGSKYAVMVNSGSSANLVAVAALFYRRNSPLKRGDEVIVPAVSWSTSYHPLQQYGLHCRFVDIDLDTLNYNLPSLKQALTEKTRMILAVNLLGNPNDFAGINSIIKGKDIIILEDNCESMGARFNGKMAGTFGLMGTFSSFFSHHISTMEGGMVVTDDEELYHIMLSLRTHGWTRNLPKLNHVTGIKSDNEFEESFKFVLPGYNFRPGEIHGAIGTEQLRKLPEFIRVRRENADYFNSLFSGHPHILIQKETGESSWFGFAVIVREDAPFGREEILTRLHREGIECRPIISGNFLKNPVLQYFDYSVSGDAKNAESIDRNGFFVGNHHYPIKEQIKSLFDNISNI